MYERAQDQRNGAVSQWQPHTDPPPRPKGYELEMGPIVVHVRVEESVRVEGEWVFPCPGVPPDGVGVDEDLVVFRDGVAHHLAGLDGPVGEEEWGCWVEPHGLLYAGLEVDELGYVSLFY